MILQFNGKYHLQEAGNRTQPNKHKFVQKVAKKNILLIYFEFSINISSVHLTVVYKIN